MRSKVLVLGAGFGGLELATVLSAELGEDAGVTLIDSNDAFVFGYSKLDVMFGRTTPDAVRLHYADFAKPGIRFLAERVTAIEPEARRVTTDQGVHEGDSLVIALGADYDFGATPGLRGGIDEFYSVRGAEHLRTWLRASRRVAPWSASAVRRSSVRPRRARRRSCFTTTSPGAASVTPARSGWSCRSRSRSRLRPTLRRRCSKRSASAASSSSREAHRVARPRPQRRSV